MAIVKDYYVSCVNVGEGEGGVLVRAAGFDVE